MSPRLRDGNFKVTDGIPSLIRVEGNKGHYRDARLGEMKELDIEYGQFGEVDQKLAKKSGEKFSNVKFKIYYTSTLPYEELGVLGADGLGAVFSGMAGIYSLQWVSEEEAKVIEKESEKGDSIEAPLCPYNLQPGIKGKFLWLTGAPGAGKSTSAQKLARDKGFVFYEADCFSKLRNPYIPVTAEDASVAQLRQRLLVGPGSEERKKVGEDVREVIQHEMSGKELWLDDGEDAGKMKRYLQLLCADITRERARVGGDWAVASAVPALFGREWREYLRSLLDNDLIIVNLELTKENLNQRIEKRHPGKGYEAIKETIRKIFPLFKPAEKGEEGIVTISINSSMDEDAVLKKILECC